MPDAYSSFLSDTIQHTRVAVKGAQTVYVGQNRNRSDKRQLWLVSETDDSAAPRLWVFPIKSQAMRAARFAAENPRASALSILEA